MKRRYAGPAVFVVELVNRTGSAVPVDVAFGPEVARLFAESHRFRLRRGTRIRVRRYVPEGRK